MASKNRHNVPNEREQIVTPHEAKKEAVSCIAYKSEENNGCFGDDYELLVFYVFRYLNRTKKVELVCAYQLSSFNAR